MPEKMETALVRVVPAPVTQRVRQMSDQELHLFIAGIRIATVVNTVFWGIFMVTH